MSSSYLSTDNNVDNASYSTAERPENAGSLSEAQKNPSNLDAQLACSEKQEGRYDHDRLPDDILHDIFILASDSGSITIPLSPERYPTQYVLSHVCSSWRGIVLSIPQLWSCVTLCCPTKHVAGIAHQWLSRAKDYRLEVTFDINLYPYQANSTLNRIRYVCDSGEEGGTGQQYGAVTQGNLPVRNSEEGRYSEELIKIMAVMPNLDGGKLQAQINATYDLLSSFRISTLTIILDPVASIEHALIFFKPANVKRCAALLTSVESLHLLGYHPANGTSSSIPFIVDAAFPNLKRLELCIGIMTRYELGIPWYQLENLDFGNCRVYVSWALTVLRQCQSLQKCWISLDLDENTTTFTSTFPPVIEPCVLPRLHELKLDVWFLGDNATNLLRAFDCPALEVLKFIPGNFPSSWPLVPDKSITKGLNLARLSTLEIDDTCSSFDPQALEDLMKSATSLRSLQLPRAYIDDQLFDKIAFGKVVPKLRHLVINDIGDIERFCRMAELRHEVASASSDVKPAVSSFEFIKFSSFQKREEYEERLSALRRKGTELYASGVFIRSRPVLE